MLKLNRLRFRRKRLVKMVAAASLMVIVLTAAVVAGTYFGVVRAAPVKSNAPLPGSVEMPEGPSGSILGSYPRQAVAADAAICSVVGK